MHDFRQLTIELNVDLRLLRWAPMAQSALSKGAPAKAGPRASTAIAAPATLRAHRRPTAATLYPVGAVAVVHPDDKIPRRCTEAHGAPAS